MLAAFNRCGLFYKSIHWSAIFNGAWLSQEQLEVIAKRQYKSIDTNPLSLLISVPSGKLLCMIIPRRLSANALTLSTFFLSAFIYFLFCFYDYQFRASTPEFYLTNGPIPNWVWFVTAALLYMILVLDTADGMHARKTGTCSPVGELLDHGTDAWRTTFMMATTMFSLFGRGKYGMRFVSQRNMLLALQMEFVLTICAPLLTGGVFFYPWSHELGHYYIIGVYVWTGMCIDGSYTWQGPALFFGSNAAFIEKITYVTIFGVSMPGQFLFILYRICKVGRPSEANFRAVAKCFTQFAVYAFSVIFWDEYSLHSIPEADPRTYLLLMAVVFSEIVIGLIISTMTAGINLRVPGLLKGVVILSSSAVAMERWLDFETELFVMRSFTFLALVVHIFHATKILQRE